MRECGCLLLAGVRGRRLRQRDVCAGRKPVHDGARLLRRRVHGGHVLAEPRLPPGGRAMRDGGRVLRAQLRRPQRRWRDHVRVAAGVSRRRRDVRDGRRVLQRALQRGAGRRHALSGAARLPPRARAVHDGQGVLLGSLRAIGGRPEQVRARERLSGRAGALRVRGDVLLRHVQHRARERRSLREASARRRRAVPCRGRRLHEGGRVLRRGELSRRQRWPFTLPAGRRHLRGERLPVRGRRAMLRGLVPPRRQRWVFVPRRLRPGRCGLLGAR